MSTGTPAAAPGWSNVPDVGLSQPAPARGGWGAGGWQRDGAAAPGRSGPVGPRADAPPLNAPPLNSGGMAGDYPNGPRPQPGGWQRDRPGGGARMAWSGRYNRIGRGYLVPGYLRAPTFVVSDWWSYGLLQPGAGLNWIRYYDDALLIDRRGRVVDSRYGVGWDRAGPPRYPDYGHGDGYEPGNYDRGFHGHGRQRDGDRDGYSVWRSGPGAPGVTVHRGGAGSTVVVVQNAPTVTTTTTTYYDEVVGSGHRKPRKVWKPRARCNCK